MSRSLSTLWVAVERFAHARGAGPATFLWNLAQGSVVPGPAELLLVPLAIADPPRAPRLAAAAAAGSIVGGCIAFWLGVTAFESIGLPLLRSIGVGDLLISRAMTLMQQYGWLFIFSSTLTPLSAKAVSIGAGAIGMPFPMFATALGLGRILRYDMVVLLLRASAGVLLRVRQRVIRG